MKSYQIHNTIHLSIVEMQFFFKKVEITNSFKSTLAFLNFQW